MRFEQRAGVEEEYKVRRSDSCLDEIIYFERPLIIFRHMLQFFEVLKPVIEQPSRYSGIPFIITS